MYLPLSWLRDYVDIDDISVEKLSESLFNCGFEVEEIIKLNENVHGIVVCRIENIERHPDADKLSVCRINAGEYGILQIVTNATNIKVGDLVPVSLDGAVLADGTKIKKGKLRGVESDGMFCGGEEIGITEEYYDGAGGDSVLVFHDDFKPGDDVCELLKAKETIFDVGLTANRPDCQSIVGLAREVAAILDKPMKEPDYDYKLKDESKDCPVKVEVKDSILCPRYMAQFVKDIKIKQSPKWMQRRLALMGLRAINSIVDITNYILLEMGQPMHAFDFDKLSNKNIVVRRAENGEKITTLDDKEFELTKDNLLICDGKNPIALAGIMGGKSSAISENSKNLLFECAKFKRDNIRKSSKALGQHSDASSRYEKGINANNVALSLKRALNLIDTLGCGTICYKQVDVLNEDVAPEKIETSFKAIDRILGISVPTEIQVKILEKLGFKIKVSGDKFTAVVPPLRDDVESFADLSEEIIRMYGYDHITCRVLPDASITNGAKTKTQLNADKLKSALVAKGFLETITYSFVSEKDYETFGLDKDLPENSHIKLMNPLGEDMSVMRTTLIPSMVNTILRNLNKKNEEGRLFELAKVYIPKALPLTELPEEKTKLVLGTFGNDDFFAVKGMIESLLSVMRVKGEMTFERANLPYLHPGRSASVMINGDIIGVFGELHPELCEKLGIEIDKNKRVYVGEFDFDKINGLICDKISFKPISKFPSVERDLALIADKDMPSAEIIRLIKARGGKNLVDVRLFDIYTGKGIEENKKSVAYRLTFSSLEKTFGEGEVDSFIKKILFFLNQNNIQLR